MHQHSTPLKLIFSTILLLLFAHPADGRLVSEKGVPRMVSFTTSDYLNAGKVWDIDSAPNGIVYMAADKGLLEFDGREWRRFRGSDGFLRSVLVKSDSLLYTGSDLDFGRWVMDETGDWRYTSLYPFRDELAALAEEFWGVYEQNGYLYFVSASNLYVYRNQNLTKIAAPSRFSGSFFFEDALWIADEQQGLLRVSEFALQPVARFPEAGPQELIGLYREGDAIMVVTRITGLLRFEGGSIVPVDSPLARELRSAALFSFDSPGPDLHVFGTVQRGFFIAGSDGRVMHHINRSKGLPNNTVLSMHFSPFGKLWAGLDYGLSSLDFRCDYTFVYDYRGDFGTAYAALLQNEAFYLGTNQGLYSIPWHELNNSGPFFDFRQIPGSEGQVWTIREIGGQVFVAHDRGLFTFRNGGLQLLGEARGTWTVTPYGPYLLAGTYNGISIFEQQQGEWRFLRQMELIVGSASQLVPEADNILWVNIPNFGFVRTRLDENLFPVERELFPAADFLGDDAFLVHQNGSPSVITSEYRYQFDAEAVAFTQKQREHHHHLPSEMLPGIFQPVSLNDSWHFFPVSNGFALQDLNHEADYNLINRQLMLRRAEIFSGNEVLSWQPGTTLPNRMNNLRLELMIPNQAGVWYQYRLGTKAEWSAPSYNPAIELIGLGSGVKELQVRALLSGELIATESIQFRVAAPWYMRWYAFLIYILLLLAAWTMLKRWHRELLLEQHKALVKRQQKESKEQQARHRQQVMLLEQERLQGELDKLEKALKNKTIELANRAKKSQDKNRILREAKEKAKTLEATSQVSKSRIQDIEKLIDSCIELEDNTFEIQLSELHQEFFRKMKELYPELSGNDLRLCAYVKLGFSAKEIAEMLHIQPSSVYISRSRLRKKLNLETDEDLYGFLNSID